MAFNRFAFMNGLPQGGFSSNFGVPQFQLSALAQNTTLPKNNPFARQIVGNGTFRQSPLPSQSGGLFGRQDTQTFNAPQQTVTLGNDALSRQLLNTFAGGATAEQLPGLLRERAPDIPTALPTQEAQPVPTNQFGGK